MSGLTVALSTTKRTMHVTRQVQDLQFRTVIPGGYASCSISLHRPLNLTPDELAFYGRLYVYDGRNGNTVWEGRVEDLGRASDSGGENWSINAVGPMAHAQDQNVPLLYQVTDLSGWQEDHDGPAWMARNTISTSTFGPGLQMFAPRDTVVPVGYYQGWRFTPYLDSGIGLAQVTLHYGEDVTDANWQWSMNFAGFSHAFTAGSSAAKTVTLATDFTGPYSVQCTLGLTRTTSSVTVANDTTAASFTNIILRSTLFDRTGAEQVTAAPYSTPLKASNVVVDLLGRMLPLYDGVNAFIDTTTDYTFTGQLAYPDGTTAAQVLDDLMILLPNMYWFAWATTATGKWWFGWRQWPTDVRYDATAQDGFTSPASATSVYDSVSVRWVDPAGNPQTTVRTLANPILDAAAFHRSTRIDLGTAVGGLTAAQQAGDQYLAQNAVPRAAGTLNIARPIFDRVLGHTVMPWEISPGFLVRVRNVAPTTNTSGDRDGVSTFRVVAVNYSDADHTAVLELDSPSISWSNQFAALQAAQQYQIRP